MCHPLGRAGRTGTVTAVRRVQIQAVSHHPAHFCWEEGDITPHLTGHGSEMEPAGACPERANIWARGAGHGEAVLLTALPSSSRGQGKARVEGKGSEGLRV